MLGRWFVRRSPPSQYEGFVASVPQDGLYVSHQGIPVYVLNRQEVGDPRALVRSLGEKANALLGETGDPDLVLQRLGRAF